MSLRVESGLMQEGQSRMRMTKVEIESGAEKAGRRRFDGFQDNGIPLQAHFEVNQAVPQIDVGRAHEFFSNGAPSDFRLVPIATRSSTFSKVEDGIDDLWPDGSNVLKIFTMIHDEMRITGVLVVSTFDRIVQAIDGFGSGSWKAHSMSVVNIFSSTTSSRMYGGSGALMDQKVGSN